MEGCKIIFYHFLNFMALQRGLMSWNTIFLDQLSSLLGYKAHSPHTYAELLVPAWQSITVLQAVNQIGRVGERRGANLFSSNYNRKLANLRKDYLKDSLYSNIDIKQLSDNETGSYKIQAAINSFQNKDSSCKCCYRYNVNKDGHNFMLCHWRQGKCGPEA